eukprot:jgi/Botrbrau1/6239/Bobra.0109s0034.2
MHNSKGECSVEYVSRNAVLDHTDQACREGSTTDSVKVDICSNGTVVVTLSEHCPVKLVAPVGDTVAPPSACGTTVHPNSNGKDTSTDTKKDGNKPSSQSPFRETWTIFQAPSMIGGRGVLHVHATFLKTPASCTQRAGAYQL